MTMRNFRQHAQGFGNTDSQVVVSLDGNIIYQGTVLTVSAPRPSLPNLDYDIENIAWSWQQPMDFQGTRQLSIAVSGSPILLGQTLADSKRFDDSNFTVFYLQQKDHVIYADPFSDVVIDGVSRTRGALEDTGQYWWWIPAGSVWAATMHVDLPHIPYIVFDSAPATVSTGAQAQFLVSIPKINPDRPLPQTYAWQIINGTSINSDFDNMSGNVTFDTADSSFSIDIADNLDLENPRNFTVQISTSQGLILTTSQAITIVP